MRHKLDKNGKWHGIRLDIAGTKPLRSPQTPSSRRTKAARRAFFSKNYKIFMRIKKWPGVGRNKSDCARCLRLQRVADNISYDS